MRKPVSIFSVMILLCLLWQACGNHQQLWLDKQQGTYYEVTEQHDGRYFVVDSFGLDMDRKQNGLKGMLLSFRVSDASSNWLTELFSDAPPQGYQLELHVYDEQMHPIYPHRFLWDTLMADTACFYTESCRYAPNQPLKVFIPFAKLSIGPGEHDIYLSLIGVGDSITRLHEKHPDRPDLRLKVRLHYQQPPVIKAQLTISGFALNEDSVDVHSYDYHVFGKGYPDLYWELYQGGEIVYTSDVIQNTVAYDKPATTPAFYITPDDSLKLDIFDFDNFSKHDFIGETSFGYKNFERQDSVTFSFGKIKNLKAEFRQL